MTFPEQKKKHNNRKTHDYKVSNKVHQKEVKIQLFQQGELFT